MRKHISVLLKRVSAKSREVLDSYGLFYIVSLAVIIAVGIGLRIYYLSQPIVHDEAFSYMAFASRPLSIGLSFYPAPNNHLLNTLLVNLTCHIFSSCKVCSPCIMRLPVFISGILVMPAAFFASKRLYNKNVAIATTALVAVSAPLIEYSVLSRGYSYVVLAFLLLIIIADRLLEKPGPVIWVLFIIVSALGFYSLPIMLYYFIAVVLWILANWALEDKTERKWTFIGQLALSCAATIVVVILLYLPVFNRSGLNSVIGNDWVKAIPFDQFVSGLPTALNSTWSIWNLNLPLVVIIFLAIGFFISLFVHGKIGKNKVNIVYPTLAVCVFFLIFLRNLPFARVWLPLLPLYFCAASAGLYWAAEKVVTYIGARANLELKKVRFLPLVFLLALVFVLGGLVVARGGPYQPVDQKPLFSEAEDITLALKGELGPEDLVVYDFVPATILRYYLSLHNVPLEHLFIAPGYMDIYKAIYGDNTMIEMPERIFLIVNDEEGYTLKKVLKYSYLEDMKSRAKLYGKFGDSRVYVIDFNDPEP